MIDPLQERARLDKLRRGRVTLRMTRRNPVHVIMMLPILAIFQLARLAYRAVQRWAQKKT